MHHILASFPHQLPSSQALPHPQIRPSTSLASTNSNLALHSSAPTPTPAHPHHHHHPPVLSPHTHPASRSITTAKILYSSTGAASSPPSTSPTNHGASSTPTAPTSSSFTPVYQPHPMLIPQKPTQLPAGGRSSSAQEPPSTLTASTSSAQTSLVAAMAQQAPAASTQPTARCTPRASPS